jgi:TMEM175 potassium channel family protein
MGKGRLEAFTDGVVAIVITIMVLELKLPPTGDAAGMLAVVPSLAIYALSFVNVGIFWNNHHHMLHATRQINGLALWANLFLLFWLSLVPFVIRWIGEAGISPLPIAGYGFVLMMSAVGYTWLERAIIAANRSNGMLAKAIGSDWKGWLSLGAYIAAMPLAFVSPWIGIALYGAVAIVWLIPDRRIEAVIGLRPDSSG